MTIITLNDDQARILSGATVPVIVQDARGRTIGKLAPLAAGTQPSSTISEADLAEIKRRMANDNGKRYTTAEVLAHLRAIASE